MVISDEQIKEFQRLYAERYGQEISKEEAYEQGTKLLCLLRRIYVPITRENYEFIQNRRITILPSVLKEISLQYRNDVV